VSKQFAPFYAEGAWLARSTLFTTFFGIEDIYHAAMTGEEYLPVAEAMLSYNHRIDHVRRPSFP
jgi:hypothetical protein